MNTAYYRYYEKNNRRQARGCSDRAEKCLAKISIQICIRDQSLSFALPDFGLGYKETVIPGEVWDRC